MRDRGYELWGSVVVALAILLVAVCCMLIVGCGDEYEDGPAIGRERPVTLTTPTMAVPVEKTPRVRPGPPSEGSEMGLTAAEERMVREAIPAARAFLRGYLPYLYGRGSALRIRRTTAALRRRLDRDAPRVIAGQREARPRVKSVEPSGFSDSRVILLATAADGSTTYPIALTLERVRGRWIVVEVR